MVEALSHNGDLMVEEDVEPNDGSVVVALLEDEVTVKRLYRQDGGVKL